MTQGATSFNWDAVSGLVDLRSHAELGIEETVLAFRVLGIFPSQRSEIPTDRFLVKSVILQCYCETLSNSYDIND